MTSPRYPCSAVILAAGASSRMGAPKALLDCGGETFLDRLIKLFTEHSCDTIVVLAHSAGVIEQTIKLSARVRFVLNPTPELGMLSSLKTGLATLSPDSRFVFFHPCDMPLLAPSTLTALVDALASAPESTLAAVPVYEEHCGHPVLLRTSLVPQILSLDGASTPRTFLHSLGPSLLRVPVNDPGTRQDFDTPLEYDSRFNPSKP